METTGLLSQQKFQEILLTTLIRAQRVEEVNVAKFVEEIKQQIISHIQKVANID